MADLFDRTMVEEGFIRPHPTFQVLPTSGYRLTEHAYAEIIQGLGIALKCKATKAQFDSCVGVHPSAAEEWVTMGSATRRVSGMGSTAVPP